MSGKVPETLSRVQFGGSPVGATGVRRGNGVAWGQTLTFDILSEAPFESVNAMSIV